MISLLIQPQKEHQKKEFHKWNKIRPNIPKKLVSWPKKKILRPQKQYISKSMLHRRIREKKGYSIIFGSGTSGTLMYGDPAIDITEE